MLLDATTVGRLLRRPSGVAVAVAAIALGAAAAAIWLAVAYDLPDNGMGLLFATVVPAALVGAFLVSRRPTNPVGWLLVVTGSVFILQALAGNYALAGHDSGAGSLPGAQWAAWACLWLPAPGLIAIVVALPLYFPDGRLPSPRWRPLAWLAVGFLIVVSPLSAFGSPQVGFGPGQPVIDNPAAISILRSADSVGQMIAAFGWLALAVAAVTSLVLRYRRSRDVERLQIKWLMYAVAVTITGFLADALVMALAPSLAVITTPIRMSLGSLIVVAVLIAILRHQLFDIDLLINRSLVYGALTVCVVAGYILVVGAVGTLFLTGDDLAVSLIATGLIAAAFAPVRNHLQRLVNRLLYGYRNEPYQALTLLGRRLEATAAPDTVLPAVVTTVSDALKLPYVAIELGHDQVFVTAAEHGTRPAQDADLLHLTLTHGGDDVGRLTLAARGHRDTLSAADRRLLEDLVRQIAVAVQAVRLASDLQRSRERLVMAREEERRRVGRDLHDGLGPQLASLTMNIEAARDLIPTNPQRAATLLTGVLDQTDTCVHDIRRVAYQLRPPTLDALGLVEAIRAHTADTRHLAVRIDAPPALHPLPAAVEVAAYRITLEALHNITAHADARHCTITLDQRPASLMVEVTDDGCGIQPGHHMGLGLTSMRERAAEIGGTLTVTAAPTGGTTVRVQLPSSQQDHTQSPGTA